VRRASSIFLLLIACSCGSGGGIVGTPFADLDAVALTSGPTRFRAWIADTPEIQARGLMDAREEDLAVRADGSIPAMLFVFALPRQVSFWMRDTEVALDLAYLDAAGQVLEIHSLQPLDETLVPSAVPVSFAFEVAAGTLAAQGIGVGDAIELP